MENPLKNVSLFSGLTEPELDALHDRLPTKSYRKNTVIIEKGDDSSFLYIILEGKVKAYVADEHSDKEIILSTQGAGEHFGELALLNDTPRTCSVMTLEDSKFLVMTKKSFKEFLSDHPDTALNLIETLVNRITTLTDEIGSLALNDVYGRVREVLDHESSEQPDGTSVLDHMTQKDLASRVGCSREMISRIFKDLKAGEYISLDKRQIRILKKLPRQW